jgi:NitT/TauT family transport system substrate-binding protein
MRRLLTPIAVLAVLATTAACSAGGPSGGGGGGGQASGASGGTTHLTVGVIPIVDVAPIYLGKEKGFFSNRGIDLELVQESGGAAAVPGVVSGDFEFSFGNVTSILLAASQNIPLRMVAEGNSSTGDKATDFSGVVVPADSPIQSCKDLAGKKVAVNNLKNIGEVTVRNAVQKDGGDPSGLTFTELGFPDMPAAVVGHQVDAAWVVEPFLTAATGQGARDVCPNFTSIPDLTVATYFTTAQYIQQNGDLVNRFRDAIEESLKYAGDHPDDVRRIVTTYTKITPDVAQKMKLPAYPQKIGVDSVKQVAQLMQQYRITPTAVDVDSLLATG